MDNLERERPSEIIDNVPSPDALHKAVLSIGSPFSNSDISQRTEILGEQMVPADLMKSDSDELLLGQTKFREES